MTAVDPPSGAAGLADLLVERFGAQHAANVAATHASLDALISKILEEHEADLAAMVRPHLEPHLNIAEYPDNLHDLFVILSQPEHQTQFFTALFAIKGIIDGFVSAALQPFVADVSNTSWSNFPNQILSPDVVALAELRDNLSGIDPLKESSMSGLTEQRYQVVLGNTGEPPGLEQLLALFRRGELSEADLDKGIRQSRVRNEWIPAVHRMRFVAPSPAEVIRGYVQNHLDEARARDLFGQGGGRPEDFEWEYETAGRPPGAGEMLQLLNRGIVSEATVREAIRESDIKNKYVDDIIAMRVYLPPPRSVVAMVRQGAITDDHARELLADHGVQPQDIEDYIRSAHSTRASAHKDLSVGEVRTLYVDRLLTRAEAQAALERLTYPPEVAKLILEGADFAREQKYRTALISHTHTLFVRQRLAQSEAVTALDRAGVDPNERDALLGLWELERTENVRLLSKAEVQGAVRRGLRTTAWARTRLLELGYAEADLDVVLGEAYPPSHFTTGG